ncbi:MAG: dTDP-4-dehydrorhamnose reductase [Pseudomonadota bacterium]
MSGARVVLFGMNGQVGSRLMETLSDAGYEVTGIDRARCDFEQAGAKEIGIIIRAVEPVLIINAAADTAVDAAEAAPARAHRINATMPGILAAAAAEQHVPLLHFSTDYVFDGASGAPYQPDATTHPLSVYAQSKLAGEQAVLAQGGTVFRLQWVFDGRGKNFFTTITRLLAERAELSIVADQLGAPSHALHIARAVTAAVPDVCAGTLPPGVYHLAAGGHTSWHGFTCAIAAGLHSSATIRAITSAEYPVAATRPKDARLATTAALAMPHWREGLTLALEEFHAHP